MLGEGPGGGVVGALLQHHAELFAAISRGMGMGRQGVAQGLRDMLQHPVAQGVTILVVELLEVVNIQDDQREPLRWPGQRLFQNVRERCTVEQFGQAVEGRSQLCALELVAQALDLVLGAVQLGQEALLLTLHQPGTLLQFAEDIRQALVGGRLEHVQAMTQTGLETAITLHTARHVSRHVIDQIDGLLLTRPCHFQLVTNDVVAKQLRGGLRRKLREILQHLVQLAVELRHLAFAVGVPKRVVHRVRRDVVTNHQGDGLLEQRRSFAGVFRVQR